MISPDKPNETDRKPRNDSDWTHGGFFHPGKIIFSRNSTKKIKKLPSNGAFLFQSKSSNSPRACAACWVTNILQLSRNERLGCSIDCLKQLMSRCGQPYRLPVRSKLVASTRFALAKHQLHHLERFVFSVSSAESCHIFASCAFSSVCRLEKESSALPYRINYTVLGSSFSPRMKQATKLHRFWAFNQTMCDFEQHPLANLRRVSCIRGIEVFASHPLRGGAFVRNFN